MKLADATTLVRTLMVFVIAYMIIFKVAAAAIIILMAVMFLLDYLDGYFAKGAVKNGGKPSWYGGRLDVAGDRVTEYVLWIVFAYLRIVPLFILFLVVLRHSFADALMGARGTSSKMKTRLARYVYSSSIGRGGISVVKFVVFSYLSWMYVTSSVFGNYLYLGYFLIGVLFIYIMVRGIAEIYESLS